MGLRRYGASGVRSGFKRGSPAGQAPTRQAPAEEAKSGGARRIESRIESLSFPAILQDDVDSIPVPICQPQAVFFRDGKPLSGIVTTILLSW
jgi:hypothetical protein